MTPEELPAYLDRMIRRVGQEAPKRSAYAMAREFHQILTDDTLTRSSHPRGTPTSAAPGGPPALVSGGLRRSVRLYPAVSTGAYRASSKVIPLIVYARIQELGGKIVAKHTYTDKRGKVRQGYLAWGSGKNRHYAKSVTIPPRPYMRPTHRQLVADGRLRKAAIAAVRGLVGG